MFCNVFAVLIYDMPAVLAFLPLGFKGILTAF